MHIDDMPDISVRLRNALFCNNILNIESIGLITEKQFLSFRNVGRKSLRELRFLMSDYKLRFKETGIDTIQDPFQWEKDTEIYKLRQNKQTQKMTEEQIVIIKEKIWWTCYNPEHRHTSKEIAERCIVNFERPRKQVSRKWTKAMYVDVLLKREQGLTLKAIGDIYGVGRQRIKEVEAKALRLKRKGWL